MEAKDLKLGDKVIYEDGEETCIAKVIAIDNEKEVIEFVDDEGFEWKEIFKDIPDAVKRKINDF